MVIYDPLAYNSRPEFYIDYQPDPDEKEYQKDWIFVNGRLLGQAMTNPNGQGFNLYLDKAMVDEDGEDVHIMNKLRTFPTMEDLRDFVESNAGTLSS